MGMRALQQATDLWVAGGGTLLPASMTGGSSTFPPMESNPIETTGEAAQPSPDQQRSDVSGYANFDIVVTAPKLSNITNPIIGDRAATVAQNTHKSGNRAAPSAAQNSSRQVRGLSLSNAIRAPNPDWVPSSAPNAPLLTKQFGFFFNERPPLDFGVMEGFLNASSPFIQTVGDFYKIHPEAIALAVYNESSHNISGWASDPLQYAGFIATGTLVGQGLGFGSMHSAAVTELYPNWSQRQSVIARMNFDYAAPLIAADMDFKASIYEQITGGRLTFAMIQYS